MDRDEEALGEFQTQQSKPFHLAENGYRMNERIHAVRRDPDVVATKLHRPVS